MADVAEQAAVIQDSLDAVAGDLRALFTEMGVERVISVDDSWVAGSEAAAFVTARLFDAQDLLVEIVRLLEEVGLEEFANVDKQNPQAVSEYVTAHWTEFSDDFRGKARSAAAVEQVDGNAIASGATGTEEAGTLSRLTGLFAPFLTVEGMGYSQWKSTFSEVSSSSVGVLVLFDRDFSEEADAGGTATTGEDLVRDLAAAGNPQLRIGMLTRSLSNERDELKETKRLESDLGVGPGQVVAIGKYRLSDLDSLPGAFRVLLLAEQIEAYRELATRAVVEAAESAKKELSNLQRYTIMGAIAAAQVEGVFELDPPLRLVRRSYERQLLEVMRDMTFATNHLPHLRSKSVRAFVNSAKAGPQLAQVLRADLFEDGLLINTLGLPLDIGDIFETDWLHKGTRSNKRYILLGQSCDISIRDGGVRKPEIAIFLLHEFRQVPADHDVRRGEVERLQSVGAFENDMISWGVSMSGQIPVPAAALDATVFNPDGKSKIRLNSKETRPMAQPWLDRHGILLKAARKMIEDYSKADAAILKVSGNKEDLLRTIGASVTGGSLSPKAGVSALIDPSDGSVAYGIRRIARMLPSAATGLLAASAAYHARPAFEAPVAISNLKK